MLSQSATGAASSDRRTAANTPYAVTTLQPHSLSPLIVSRTGPGPARFSLLDGSVNVLFTDTGWNVLATDAKERRGWGLQWTLVGAQKTSPRPERAVGTEVKSYRGSDPKKWAIAAPAWSALRYAGVYPGIDLLVESRPDGMKYSFEVSPGADVKLIRMRVSGVDAVTASSDARALQLRTGLGTIQEQGLLCFQPNGKERRELAARFAPSSAPLSSGDFEYGFSVDGVDPSLPLTIDPGLVWTAMKGGANQDEAKGLALDPAGKLYLSGQTYSADFPLTGAFDSTFGGTTEAFAMKVDLSTNQILWATYLGGSGDESSEAVTFDSSGNAYLTGTTQSADFPVAAGYDSALGGTVDGFVTKLSATGAVVWSTYLGGTSGLTEGGHDLAVDSSGNVYVTGETSSNDFPKLNAFDTNPNQSLEAFITKINASGTTLAWSSFLGGNGDETGEAIAVDGSGNVFVAGQTKNPSNNNSFPIVGGFDSSTGAFPSTDGFVAKISGAGPSLTWCSPLGGTGDENVLDLALDAAGNVYLTGSTGSTDFPTAGGFDSTLGNSLDAFVAKVAANGASLVWSSYLGGSTANVYEDGRGIAVDSAGNVYVTGETYLTTDFPLVSPFNTSGAGFVARVNASGSSLDWSSNLGIANAGDAIALDSTGSLFVAGLASSSSPPQPGGFGPTGSSGSDLFVMKIGVTTGDSSPPVVGPVLDGNTVGTDIDAQSFSNSLSANWTWFTDPESGIVDYAFGIGSTPGATDVLPFTSVGLLTRSTQSSLTLADGATYYVTIRATNGAGLTAVSTSDGVTVDKTPPVPGAVNDGTGADVDTQTSLTTIEANWTGFSDPQSGIVRYDWAIGTAVGGTDVQAFTSVGTATSASRNNLILSAGVTYYVTVKATNGTNGSTLAYSDGVTVTTGSSDTTPPVVGVVSDGAGADIDVQSSMTSIAANWSGFADPESGIVSYEWAIGTTTGGTDTQPFISVGTATSANASALSLSNGTTYYVSVRAMNGAGLTATGSSDGVQIVGPMGGDGGSDAGSDGGSSADAGSDAGIGDGGSASDGGTDAGTDAGLAPDAGGTLADAGEDGGANADAGASDDGGAFSADGGVDFGPRVNLGVGCGCSGGPGGVIAWLGAALLLARRSRRRER